MPGPHPIDEIELPPFEGFPREGLAFLRALKKNNNREWFRARREKYEETVRFPMQCLVASLARRMADAAPEIEFHPRTSIFRIYRDTRFSRNKTPYKTNIAASFPIRGRKGPAEVPGLYVGVEPGEAYAGGGLYLPSGAQLKLIRASIAGDPDAWLAVVATRRFLRSYGGIEGEKLVRAPLGYPPDHPMIEHLKYKQFFAGRSFPEEACLRGSFVAAVERVFLDILPLIRWLVRSGA
jgi:uncharacterized protein (TIGR02453 family)